MRGPGEGSFDLDQSHPTDADYNVRNINKKRRLKRIHALR
jgi:hypothetical protein